MPVERTVSLLTEELDEAEPILCQIYLALARTYVEGGGILCEDIRQDYLPAAVFEVAKLCNWVSRRSYQKPPILSPNAVHDPSVGGYYDPDVSSIGPWLVAKRFETEFMKRLSRAMEVVRTIAETHQSLAEESTIHWKEPTPPQIVDGFLRKMHWSKNSLIKMVSGIDEYVDDATKQMLKRLYKPPSKASRLSVDIRTGARLTKLRDIMAAAAPEYYSQLTVIDLCWTPE